VALTAGFSGAEVVAVCSEAALLALEADAETVSSEMLQRAARGVKPQIDAAMLAFYHSYRQKHRTL